VGTGRIEDEQVLLSRIVDVLNERFGTEFTNADELFWDQVGADATADEALRDAGEANTIDNFATSSTESSKNLSLVVWTATATRSCGSSITLKSASS
jgi:type I restriction enzyme R subunit